MRNDTKANWIFAVSALAFAAAFAWRLHNDSLASNVLYFLTQSAFIGSAADWFAVTALFRKPLGIPFHTALIPRNRERIIRGIRRTAEEYLVKPELWQGLAGRFSLSSWLREKRQTEQGKRLEMRLVVLAEREVRRQIYFHRQIWSIRIREQMDSLPSLAAERVRTVMTEPEQTEKVLQKLLSGGQMLLQQEEVQNAVCQGLREFTDSQKSNLLIAMAISTAETMGVIDYRDMSASICRAAGEKLQEWSQPEHPYHAVLRDKLAETIRSFMATPEASGAVNAVARQAVMEALPASVIAEQIFGKIVKEWKKSGRETESMQQLLRTLLHEALDRWLNDPEACNEMDRIFRQMFFNAALYEHAFLGDTVESVLHAYSREKMNAFIYEKTRDELGWVRINGALFAAAAGGCLFGLFALMFS